MRYLNCAFIITFWFLMFSIVNANFGSKSFALEEVKVGKPGVAKTHNGKKIYMQDFSYSFPGKKNVFIDNLGTVPASGHLKFYSEQKTLQFRECRECAVFKTIAAFSIKYKVIGKVGIPPEESYLEARQQHEWLRPPDFTTTLFDTLGKFGFDYATHERDQFSYVRTTWLNLANLPKNLTGRISFIFSYPSEQISDRFHFKIGKLTIERRVKTRRFRPADDDDVIREGKNLQSKIIGELIKLKGRQKNEAN